MTAQYNDLKDRVVFVSGGSAGIGAQIVRAFIQQGAKVAFVANDQKKADRLRQSIIQEQLPSPLFVPCDIRDIQSFQQAISTVKDTYGPIDVLINNAADDRRHSIENYSVEDWDNSINTNLRPHFFSAQAVLPEMKRRKSGSIINVGSNSSLLGLPDYPSYVAAKAGIVGLTKALARELGQYNIRVNALIPGWVMTERQKREWATPEAIQECLQRQCLKRMVTEADVANCALFLASETSAMMTSQSLVVDGGRA